MHSVYLSFTVSSADEAERIYGLLSDGQSDLHADAGKVFLTPALRCSAADSARPGSSFTNAYLRKAAYG